LLPDETLVEKGPLREDDDTFGLLSQQRAYIPISSDSNRVPHSARSLPPHPEQTP
jgi:hypothetical protein